MCVISVHSVICSAPIGFIRLHIFLKILKVNLFAFAYRLFHEDFSPNNRASYICQLYGLYLKLKRYLMHLLSYTSTIYKENETVIIWIIHDGSVLMRHKHLRRNWTIREL